jgi:hypothetical protein
MKPEKDPKTKATVFKGVQPPTTKNVTESAKPGQKPADIKGGRQGIQKGDRVMVILEDFKLECPCTNGEPCETFKDKEEADAKSDAEAGAEKVNKKVDPLLKKAEEDLKTAKDKRDAAKSQGKKKSEIDQLQKKVDAAQAKVDGLKKMKEDAAKKVADSAPGRPAIKNATGKQDAVGGWKDGKFTFDAVPKNDDKKKIELSFQLTYYCAGAGCVPAHCSRAFVVQVEQ